MLVRLARDLPDFLGTPITASQSLERVRARVGQREHAFLATVERTVFGHPRSPYLRLLRHVGCERGDFRALVRREGVEGALSSLATQGVYVTFDELKGRRPIVRGSLSFHPSDRDFDAPFVYGHYLTFTGGTRGRPARVPRPLPFVEELATSYGASLAAHGIEHARTTYWLSNPVTTMLFAMKLGQAPELWLHPIAYRAARARFGAGYLRLLGRLNGRPIPRPRLLVAGEARRLARWLNHRSSDGRPTIVHTVPSSAVRVAVAAGEDGIELGGVTFFLQSEPLTEARRRHVETSGAGVIATYTSIEASVVGLTCASPSAADDYHLMADRFALVTREREAVAGGPTVPALLVSTLTDTVPKVCFNAELGDYARVEQRACGCMFGTLGLTTHLFEVRSFEKLSGEGVTFARSNALRILEETLPARFGGTALDYQLVEEEGSDSATRLILRVSPSVGRVDEDVLKGALLVELGQGGLVDRHHAELLRRAGSVAIVREPPLATQAGKVLPFQLQRAQRAPGHAPR